MQGKSYLLVDVQYIYINSTMGQESSVSDEYLFWLREPFASFVILKE